MQIYGLLRNLFYCLKGMKMMIIQREFFFEKARNECERYLNEVMVFKFSITFLFVCFFFYVCHFSMKVREKGVKKVKYFDLSNSFSRRNMYMAYACESTKSYNFNNIDNIAKLL